MTEILFYIFAGITVLSALFLVANRNPVNSAMLMIVSFVGTAALFFMLEAYLLGALQIIVYAGAVVVLFLFIIMLLRVDEQTTIRPGLITTVASLIAFVLLALGIAQVISAADGPTIAAALPDAPGSHLSNYGYLLFSKYLLPFQLTGFLLLVAMVGVIVLSKRMEEETGAAAKPASPEAPAQRS